ncbi:MAG: 6-phospho-beta-glucosidase [Thermanaerothrix sp.]|nr:6-phospho-beta-glucosidase [Thermanaerothrix sp.]
MKITVIGGGSTYTPELVKGFLARTAQLPLRELWLMDVDEHRLAIVGGFVQRMVEARGRPFRVILTANRREALAGASYVCTQLRVGQMEARRQDEYLARRHGLIGQETTGIGGMAKALRTIPVVLEIAREMKAVAPDAWLINFTNPAGLIVEALNRYAPEVRVVGVCNVPYTAKMQFLTLLRENMGREIVPERAELKTLGLNHLTWHYGLVAEGEDLWPYVLKAVIQQVRGQAHPEWEPRYLESTRMIPNYYLHYYYHTEEKLREQAHWPPSRAEQVMQIETELLKRYADPALVDLPPELMQRGGAYYSTVATQLISAHYNDLGEIHVVNVPNRGAVKEWDAQWVLELPACVSRRGIDPLPAQPLPPFAFGLVAAVKAYEILTVRAAAEGDIEAAYQALITHPLGPRLNQAEAVLEDMLATHWSYLPQFQDKVTPPKHASVAPGGDK